VFDEDEQLLGACVRRPRALPVVRSVTAPALVRYPVPGTSAAVEPLVRCLRRM